MIEINNEFLSQPGASKRARLECIRLLGGRCQSPECRWKNLDGTMGCNDFDYLQLDHVEGGGSLDRKKGESNSGTYIRFLKEVQNGSTKFQVLCANCNYKKGSWWKDNVREFSREFSFRINGSRSDA